MVVCAPWTKELNGLLVVVDRLAVHGEVVAGLELNTNGLDSWICRSAVEGGLLPAMANNGFVYLVQYRGIADKFMRPIRPDEGDDESLAWPRNREESK